MSSHHIIRENQEAALFFYDDRDCNEEILAEVLEWSPLVMATPASVSFLGLRGIKVDVIIARPNQALEKSLHFTQYHIRFETSGKSNAIDGLFQYLRRKNHRSVIIFGSFQQLKPKLDYQEDVSISVIDGAKKWSLVKSKIKKWFPQGSCLELEPVQNVKVIYKDEEMDHQWLQKLPTSGMLTFRSIKPFWLGEKVG